MFEFHRDRAKYFDIQYLTARDHIIPFLTDVNYPCHVMEIGCGEAGVLKAFLELGCECLGIELSEHRTARARSYHEDAIAKGQIRFINKNIYDIDIAADLGGQKYDLIILKDVIEHIHEQEKFIPKLKDFLQPGGKVFFGFPPWYMPFGGHQQMCDSKILRYTPYYHLLPSPMYRGLLRGFGEPESRVGSLLEIKETGISVERFQRIVKRSGFEILQKKFWLLNPIYKYKFGRGPIAQASLISVIPGLRNFLSTAAYYTIGLQP